MRKIYSFSKFNAIYEEETSSSELNVAETEASKLYDQTLGLILTTILNSYNSETYFPSKEYTKANIDLDNAEPNGINVKKVGLSINGKFGRPSKIKFTEYNAVMTKIPANNAFTLSKVWMNPLHIPASAPATAAILMA